MTTTRHRAGRGSSVAEALAAAAVAGVALAAVVLVARLAGSGLRLARDTSAALTLAETRLEELRTDPQEDGADEITADGVPFARTWRVSGGRGLPTHAEVEVSWREHRLSLTTGALR